MSVIQFIHKALDTLKNTDAWYSFEKHFWTNVTGEEKTLKLLSGARYTLTFLKSEVEHKILESCKHENANNYDTFEMCNDCQASRRREKHEDSMWPSYEEWSPWGWH